LGEKRMRLCRSLALAAFVAAGCARVVTIEAEMPPLVPVDKNVNAIGIGEFTTRKGTPPELAKAVAGMLAEEIRRSSRYKLATAPEAAQLVISGEVLCRISDVTVKREFETFKTRIAEVAVKFTGANGTAAKRFAVTERPAAEGGKTLPARLRKVGPLRQALLRACVEALVADISPRRVRVRVPRPGLLGQAATRRGIDLLSEHPGRAVHALKRATEQNPRDAAAANALGFCCEVTGDLELALSGYVFAAKIDPRKEYRENMERAHRLLERRRAILNTGKP